VYSPVSDRSAAPDRPTDVPGAGPARRDASTGPRGRADRSAVPIELRAAAREAWETASPRAKARAALELGALAANGGAVPDPQRGFAPVLQPGRPERPLRVHPRDVPARGAGSPTGRAALLHSIAHIEFNAIDLALDAVWRFDGLPSQWYLDWASVASEEALHFGLLADALERRGHAYGDFDAHDGLWEMAVRTCDDVLARIALVPRVAEARGLDVTPLIQRKLAAAGDLEAVAILQRILDDEVGHVALGNRWYRHLCERAGLDPEAAWDDLAARYGASPPRPPFNVAARLRAGFTEAELARWG
jgi:uncharacterized ferritin-like protein (DUF455 family)